MKYFQSNFQRIVERTTWLIVACSCVWVQYMLVVTSIAQTTNNQWSYAQACLWPCDCIYFIYLMSLRVNPSDIRKPIFQLFLGNLSLTLCTIVVQLFITLRYMV